MNTGYKYLIMIIAATTLFSNTNQAAEAQYIGSDSHNTKVVQHGKASPENTSPIDDSMPKSPSAPILQGAEHASTTGGDSFDSERFETIPGIYATGTVRVNMLANLEALLNICANGGEIIGILWGSCLLWACTKKLNQPGFARAVSIAILPMILGACSPAAINWAISVARDANFFS